MGPRWPALVLWIALPLGVGAEEPAELDPVPEGARFRLGSARFRHSEEIQDLACSPDGRFVAGAGSDNSISVWDRDGRVVATIPGEDDDTTGTQAIAYSPDGQLIAHVQAGGLLRVVEAASGAVTRRFSQDEGIAEGVDFSRDGSWVVRVKSSGVAEIGEVRGERPAREIGSETMKIRSAVPSADGRTLFTGAEDGTLVFWDLATGDVARSWKAHSGGTTALALSSRGLTLVSGGGDGKVCEWDAGSGELLLSIQAYSERVARIEVSADGERIASWGGDNLLRVWEFGGGEPVGERASQPFARPAFGFEPGTRCVVVAVGNGVTRWDPTGRANAEEAPSHLASIRISALSPDGSTLATGSDDGTVRTWEIQSGRAMAKLDLSPKTVTGVAWGAGGGWLATTDSRGTLRLWDPETGAEVDHFENPGRRPFSALAADPRGARLAALGDDGRIRVWDSGTRRETRVIEANELVPGWLSLLDGGRLLMADRFYKGAQFWDAESGEPVAVPVLGGASLLFAPDESLAASRHGGSWLDVRETASGVVVRRLEGKGLGAPAFHPSVDVLATSSEGRAIVLWDLSEGQVIRRLPGHDAEITWMAFTPDGKSLVSTSRDSTVIVWDVETTLFRSASGVDLGPSWEALRAEDVQAAATGVETLVAHPAEAVALIRRTAAERVEEEDSRVLRAGETLRRVRAVEVLERIDSAESRETLGALSKGPADGRAAREARAALDRLLAQRPPVPPSGPRPRIDRFGDPLPERAIARIGTARCHAKGVIRCLRYVPDGARLMTLDDSERLSEWDLSTGRCLKECGTQTGSAFALSADGRFAGIGARDGQVYVVATDTGGYPVPQSRHGDEVTCLAFSPDGESLLSGGADGALRLWDSNSGLEVGHVEGIEASILAVCAHPDGRRWAASLDDKEVRLWETGAAETRVLLTPAGAARCLAFSHDGGRLAGGVADGSVRIWDAGTGRELSTMEGGASRLTFTADDALLVARDREHGLRAWKAEDWREAAALDGLPIDGEFAVSPDGATVAFAENDVVRFWEWTTGARPAPVPTCPVTAADLSPDGRVVATGGRDGSVGLWKAEDGTLVRWLPAHAEEVHLLRFLPDGSSVLSVAADGSAQVCDAADGRRTALEEGEPAACAALTLDGMTLFVAEESNLRVVEASSLMLLEKFWWRRPVTALAASPDGRTLFVADDAGLHELDVERGKAIGGWPSTEGPIRGMAATPDGRRLALASWKLSMFERATGGSFPVRERFDLGGGAIVADARGRWVAVAGRYSDITIFDALSGRQLGSLSAGQREVVSLAGSSDGMRLCSGGADGTVVVWDLLALAAGDSGEVGFQGSLKALGEREPKGAIAAAERLRSDPERAVESLRETLAAPFDGAPPTVPLGLSAGDALRRIRAVHLLARIGTAEALRALETVVESSRESAWGRVARNELDRLRGPAGK